jgi:hypothetical protein
MMHWKNNFDYKFTGAYELQPGETKTLTIKSTGHAEVMNQQGKKETCFVAYFEGANQKPMVLNKTNCKTIGKLYTDFIENWNGKQITIKSEKVKAFGEVVEALRVVPIVPKKFDFDKIIQADIAKLKACKSGDELKSVYMSLETKADSRTIKVKDELKLILK